MKPGWLTETEEWLNQIMKSNVGCTTSVTVSMTITPNDWERGGLELDNPGVHKDNTRT